MPTPATNTQLNQMFDRARSNGWQIGAVTKGRFKLTHPQASKPIFANASVKAVAAMRDLESEMTKALGPMQTMQTPSSGRLSKAALQGMSPNELLAIIETATASRKQMEHELAAANLTLQKKNAELETLGAEIGDFIVLRDTLTRIFSFGPSSQASPAPRPAKAPTKRALKAAAAVAQGQATPAPKKRAAASAKKAAPNGRATGKSAAPGKRAGAAKPGRKAKAVQLAPTPLEKAIDASKQEAGANTFTTPTGQVITPENSGKLLRAHREQISQTQGEAAPLLGVSSTTLVSWEKGHTVPQTKALGKIAAYLRTPEPAKGGEAQSSSAAM